jgi:hypothetical protein
MKNPKLGLSMMKSKAGRTKKKYKPTAAKSKTGRYIKDWYPERVGFRANNRKLHGRAPHVRGG